MLTNSIISAVEKTASVDRVTSAAMCVGYDFDKLTSLFHTSMLKHISKSELDSIASFLYSDSFRKYEAALQHAVNETLTEVSGAVCLLSETKPPDDSKLN